MFKSNVFKALPFILLLAQLLLIFFGALQMGLAYDEIFHIPEAIALYSTGVRKLVPDHAPLAHWVSGFFSSFALPYLDKSSFMQLSTNAITVANQVLFDGQNEYRFLLLTSRIPFILLGVAASFYSYKLSQKLWGSAGAVGTLFLCCLCPSIICWSRFVYTDLILSFCIVATLYYCWLFYLSKRITDLFLLGIFSALTICSKYSGLVILFIILIYVLFCSYNKQNKFKANIYSISRNILFLISTVYVVSWVIFGFPNDAMFYVRGIGNLYSTVVPNYRFYFMQEFKTGTWWNYFIIVLFLKIPLIAQFSTLCALFTVTWAYIKRREFNLDTLKIIFLCIPLIIFLIVTTSKAIPAGARYVLPCHFMIYIISGYFFKILFEKRNQFLKILVSVLALIHIYRTLSIFPDEMAYFSEFVGGPEEGIMWLNDTSIDAGQNLPRLAKFLRDYKGTNTVRMLYQGMDRPEKYGIKREVVTQEDWDKNPRPGLYAISANWLVYGQLETQERGAGHKNWLTTYKPIKIIGGSIWIYEW